MRSAYLNERFGVLGEALDKAKTLSGGNVELEGFLTSYLVVLFCGAYEDCIEHLLVERASKTGDAEVRNYVQTTIHRLFRNPKFQEIVRAVSYFSDAYARELEERVDTRAREAIGSIVTNKNNISHGKVSAVTLGDLENYHRSAIPIFEVLEDILGLA